MIKISLKDFTLTGSWGDIKLGMSREAFLAIVNPLFNIKELGLKRLKEYVDYTKKDTILLYGNVEFYFNFLVGSNNTLDMIYSDYFQINGTIIGGSEFEIDNWFLKKLNNLEYVTQELDKENIKYKMSFSHINTQVYLNFDSGVVWGFERNDIEYTIEEYYLVAIHN